MKTPMTIQTEKTLREIGDNFRQFARNGRWGTCAGCPRDVQGNAYPEHCADTDRYDHHLTATGLAETWDRYFKANAERIHGGAAGLPNQPETPAT